MAKHSKKQSLVFLYYINQCIKNPHLTLYIRELLKGEDVQTKAYLNYIPPCETLKQDAYELLWAYVRIFQLKNQYLTNTLENITLELDEKGRNELKLKLEQSLELLGLPYGEEL